ncbi:MAG: GTPase HflX [Deltaproteobacteria bacterium]|nr:MAG: GTPase HflX [Deltaproteobacteria bacterium]
MRNRDTLQKETSEKALLVGVRHPAQGADELTEALDELSRLAQTAQITTVGRITQRREAIDATYFVGEGKVREIAAQARALDADTVIFDDDLSPAQARNLERVIERRILDRTELILEIFARNARTKEAAIQVEIARLSYLLPRLARRWGHLHRQRGGIGLREAGESQIELDRRIVRERIQKLERELAVIRARRETRRKRRRNCFTVALVGYTNAGKSTLLRALTDSEVLVADRLFATLDAKVSRLPNELRPPVLLIDTVGFIKKLPPHLVASFKSTLEEVAEADLLLHVVDLSHPAFAQQIATTDRILSDLGLQGTPRLHVFNKIDRVTDPALFNLLRRRFPDGICVSGETGEGIETLERQIFTFFERGMVDRSLRLRYEEQGFVREIREMARILEEAFEEEGVRVRYRTTAALADRIERRFHEFHATRSMVGTL